MSSFFNIERFKCHILIRGTAGGRPYKTMHTTALSLTDHESHSNNVIFVCGPIFRATLIINIQNTDSN